MNLYDLRKKERLLERAYHTIYRIGIGSAPRSHDKGPPFSAVFDMPSVSLSAFALAPFDTPIFTIEFSVCGIDSYR